jgi:hypothetical protein
MLLVGNLVSIGLIFSFQALLDLKPKYDGSSATPMFWAALAIICSAMGAVAFYNGEYKRLNSESTTKNESNKGGPDHEAENNPFNDETQEGSVSPSHVTIHPGSSSGSNEPSQNSTSRGGHGQDSYQHEPLVLNGH